jgi:hypothetical protein
VTFAVACTAADRTTAWAAARDLSALFLAAAPPSLASPAAPTPVPEPPPLPEARDGAAEARLREVDVRLTALATEARAEEPPERGRGQEPSAADVASAEAARTAVAQRRAELEARLAALPATVPAPTEVPAEDRKAAERLKDLRAKLAALERILGPRHGQVADLARQVEALEARASPAPRPPAAVPNPALEPLRAELAAADRELTAAGLRLAEARQAEAGREDARRRSLARKDERRARRLAEQTALAEERAELVRRSAVPAAPTPPTRPQPEAPQPRADTFTLVTPARLPEAPLGPRRLSLGLASLGLALGLGGGWTLARGRGSPRITSPERAAQVSGLPVLAVVPRAHPPGGAPWTR